MRALIEVRSNVGFMDGEFAIAIVNVHTRQSVVPPIAFGTREAAEAVADAIVAGNPQLYTRDRSWLDRGEDKDWWGDRW